MKYVKMLGLAVVAAAALMAFVGAGTASATGVLCSTTTGEAACPAAQRWAVGTVIHMTLEESLKTATTGGITASTCTEATVTGTITTNTGGATTATSVNEVISWGTVATPCTKTATTVALGKLKFDRIAGTSNGTVTADEEIKVTTTGLFSGETCNYGVTAGTSLGTLTEGKPATFDLNAVVIKLAGHTCTFGPQTTKWTGKYTVTSPATTTLSVSSS